MPTTFTMLARKGGVGRTTLSVSIAGELAKRGARTLCIDLDGQASLSRVFFGSPQVERFNPAQTVAAVLADYGSEPDEVIHKTSFENIAVLPAGDAVEKLAMPEANDTIVTIRDFIQDVRNDFDVIMIDTPPNTNVATTMAGVVAADYVLSPVPADAFGTQSIISVQRTVADAVQYQPNLRILGYIFNQLQRNSVNDSYIRTVRQLHGDQVFDTEISLAVAFRESMAARTPISHHKAKTKAAQMVATLVDEMNQRIETLSQRRAA